MSVLRSANSVLTNLQNLLVRADSAFRIPNNSPFGEDIYTNGLRSDLSDGGHSSYSRKDGTTIANIARGNRGASGFCARDPACHLHDIMLQVGIDKPVKRRHKFLSRIMCFRCCIAPAFAG
jgi:hypothetical protein